MSEHDFSEFTIDRYRDLCIAARENYDFLRFGDNPDGPGALWRHDVDISVRHALQIAEIEAELGVVATYCLLPHAICFNLWSAENRNAVRQIAGLGHEIGLHFDAGFYEVGANLEHLERRAATERRWLEELVGTPISAISFHNYGAIRDVLPDTHEVAGMINAYAARFHDEYRYTSDSNGIWQHENLHEVITSHRYDRVHALTHPVWWTRDPMAPRARLQACINAAADEMGRWWDDMTAQYGRPNVRG